ncbi:MAG: hypothetical protein MUC41_04300 [Syntrophobacteraceae bacterium]|nr:hypothetical protein [Syntrophobacteraceae bacterium]
MNKIRLGGVKILDGRSRMEVSFEPGVDALSGICRRVGAEKINISLLTHIADNGNGRSATALCTTKSNGFSGYFLIKTDARCVVELQQDVSLPSIFPHDRRPLVIGGLIGLLGREGIHPLGLASSPSAISAIIPSMETKRMIDGLFDVFVFPEYNSPLEWHAAYTGKEEIFKDVLGSYEEQAIKVYAVQEETGLVLWSLRMHPKRMEPLGKALRSMEDLHVKLPFFIAHCEQDGEMILSACIADPHEEDFRRILADHLPWEDKWSQPAACVFLHGPHFGDRYRIADALAGSLQEAGIQPLALSCAVHSISVVFKPGDLRPGVTAISTKFHVP